LLDKRIESGASVSSLQLGASGVNELVGANFVVGAYVPLLMARFERGIRSNSHKTEGKVYESQTLQDPIVVKPRAIWRCKEPCMKLLNSPIFTITLILSSVFVISAAHAADPVPPRGTAALTPEVERARKEWSVAISRVPLPKKTGCFEAAYPNREWREVQCGAPSKDPNPPRPPSVNTIGSTNGDITAVVSPSLITAAVGSFDSVTPSTVTETGPYGGSTRADAFTLQINTQFFTNTSYGCNGITGCQEWEQFIYSGNQCSGACVFMEYWLLGFGTCPTDHSWTTAGTWSNGKANCFFNSASKSATAVTAAQLQNTTLTATASGGTDTVVLTSSSGNATATAVDSVLSLEQNWNSAEFNIFGDCCSSAASFSGGTTMTVRTSLTDGSEKKPVCSVQSFTAETNNLSFGPTTPGASGTTPAILFTQSSAGGLAACAAATSIGDTHLTTFGSTLYDFQSSGDFLLAQSANPEFIVHARQESGAPTWPNATLNKAVATRMGKSTVAVCLKGLAVDGKSTEIRDGKVLHLPGGVGILRNGNVYSIRDLSGNWVRAEIIDPYINVSVGLGRWPADVRGILANARGSISEIAARDGSVLSAPFPFADLYHHYADSWRVPAKESLLSVCGEGKREPDVPQKEFFAKDLEPKVRERAEAICKHAGVKAGALFYACTLDVAVIGNEKAAKAFVGMPTPAANGNPGGRGGDERDRTEEK
jgi:hypothetical protein